MSDVYIVGTDMIRFGRFPERTVPSLAAEAALMALDDAGLTIDQMQALYCGNLAEAGGMVGQLFLRSLDRSDRVHYAMQSRGYTGDLLTMNPHHMTRADWLALALAGALALVPHLLV